MSKTLADLRLAIRQRADQENSQFISDSELNSYINASYAELYDLLTSRFVDYYTINVEFDITTGNTFPLPDGFYKMIGLDQQASGYTGKWATVYPFVMGERNKLSIKRRVLLSRIAVNYRLIGNNLVILPEENAGGHYQLWYIPRFTPLVAYADEMGDILDFDDYVVVDCCIKCAAKEETDASVYMQQKVDLKARVEAMAANRDAGQSEKITDNQVYRTWYYPYEW
jgi:hypothetical protein